MSEPQATTARQRHTWWLLMALTLASGVVAESVEPTAVATIAVCLTVAIKGSQVIDELMGLRFARPLVRRSMKFYFLVVPSLISAVVMLSG